MSSKVPRVAAYLRISKADPASSSIEKQRDNIQRLVAKRWPSSKVVEFVDEGVSATKAKARPAFTRLQSSLADFDFVVFDKQDRIARKPLDFWQFAADAEKAGTAIVGASEPLDLSSADGELTAGIRLTVARAEARRTGDRVRATNTYRNRSGLRSAGGPAVFGLRRIEGNRDHFEPDPVRAPLVLEAVETILAGEASITSTTSAWTARGIPTPRGGAEWTTRTVSKILRSPALAGMVVAEGDVLRGPDGLPIVRPEEGLIDVDKWHRLQAAIDARVLTRAPAKPARPRPLLAGLLIDADGQPLHAHRLKGRPPRYTSRTLNGKPGTSIQMDLADTYVRDQVLAIVGRMEEVRPVIVSAARDSARLASVRAEIQRTLAGMADPSADIPQLAARLTAQRTVEADLAAASSEDSIELRPTGKTIREAYTEAPDDEVRRQIISGPLRVVVVRPGVRGKRFDKPSTAERLELVWRR